MCLKTMDLTMPCLLDNMENTTEQAYGGWPDHICIVDINGKVAYGGDRGPKGFNPAEAGKALEALPADGGRIIGGGAP